MISTTDLDLIKLITVKDFSNFTNRQVNKPLPPSQGAGPHQTIKPIRAMDGLILDSSV